MIDLKPYGAFIEFTVRPLIDDLNKMGLQIDEKSVNKVIYIYFIGLIIDFLKTVVIAGIICFTAYRISVL